MGYIYKVTNKLNGDKYIGQTTRSIYTRWMNHKKRAENEPWRNEHFINAIRKYGEENFIIELIEECPNEKLSERERYWIAKYNTFHGPGYNSTEGGEGTLLYNRAEILNLWNSGLSVGEIAEKIGAAKSTISSILREELKIPNEEILCRSHEKAVNIHKKSLEQYDLDGILINTYSCVAEVEQKLGFSQKAISDACRKNLFSNNFYWKYCEDAEPIENKIKAYLLNKNIALKKSVKQYDLNGNFIAKYNSQIEAEEKTGIFRAQISRVCLEKEYTAGSYLWCFSDDDKDMKQYAKFIKTHPDPKSMKVKQYDLNGNYITSFNSMTEAAAAVNGDKTAIQKAVRNHYTSNNYIWILPGEEEWISKIIERHNTKHDSKKKIVYQYDKNGNFLNSYPSATDACIAMGLDVKKHRNLARNCQGYQNSFNGYVWSYNPPENYE